MVADIPGANGYPGCYPTDLTAAGGLLYFPATDSSHGYQLWAANGTGGGDDDADPRQRGEWRDLPAGPDGGRAARCTSPASTRPTSSQLWASNGTAADDGAADELNASGPGLNPQMLTAVGGTAVLLGQRRDARDAALVDHRDDDGRRRC